MMKNLFFLVSACFLFLTSAHAQCELDFAFKNTGTNMTAFFTPPASQSIYSELGEGTIGAFFLSENGDYICGASDEFSSAPTQLAVMADDSTTPEKDGFSGGDQILWFYETIEGKIYGLDLDPAETFAINGITYISSATVQDVDCGDLCPPLETEYVNTGANMTLFVTPSAAEDLLSLGNGVLAVYFEVDEALICAGSAEFVGTQDQITAMADDATTTEKDGFSDGDLIVWKYQDVNGNQYDVFPSPSDPFSLNGISFVTSIDYETISCAVDVEGCTNEGYLEYNPLATIDDNSCSTIAQGGCTDDLYIEYDPNANIDNGSCVTLIVSGCTDSNYLEFNTEANVDDDTCETPVVFGCNNANAENFNPNANSNDGSCEYDLIPDDCVISFETINTGANHTIMVPGSATDQLNIGDLIGVFYISEDGSTLCAGSSEWTGANMQIVAYGDDTTTPEVDGLASGSSFLFLAKSDNDIFIVDASFQSPNMNAYEVNGLSFITTMELDYSCTEEKLGCTDAAACNYDVSANTNDSSCTYPNDFYLCSGACVNDVDNDSVCDELEVEGCTDQTASNFDADASDDNGTCVSWEDAYKSCLNSGGDDGVTQADVDAVQVLLDVANTDLATALANQSTDDGVTQADVDAVQALLDVANADLATALANQSTDDGVTQADVDAVQALLDVANADLATALANQSTDDGVTQTDVDAVQALLDIANEEIDNLNVQLGNINADDGGEGSCSPIYVELLEGWNIIGYTLSYEQDVTATMASVVDDLQIVKNNDAKVYWPEYGFNGIGNYIPGQGYQIRMSSGIDNYTFPDVGSQRIELHPTVPNWVYDLPILNHPNDTKTLVKVVNMLGREVIPSHQFKGEVLLYLYSDGTTEKRLAK
ncbi:hypothetical protein N9Y06_04025 [Flavobacteriales bacterium]|nr:hypothetical protein [Flavobacteriales bacterium]